MFKKQWASSLCLSELFCFYGVLGWRGCWSGGLFHSEDVSLVSVLYMWTIHSSLCLWLSLKGILGFPWRPWHMLMWISFCCCFLSLQSTDIVTVQLIQFVLQNALNWPRWNSQHISNLTDGHSSVFEDMLLYLVHIFIRCRSRWTSWAFTIFSRGHTALEL